MNELSDLIMKTDNLDKALIVVGTILFAYVMFLLLGRKKKDKKYE